MQTVKQASSLWQLFHPTKVIRMKLTTELQGQLKLNTSSVFLFTVVSLPPLALSTLIYLLLSGISLTRDNSPPETNQHTHTRRLLLCLCSSKLAPEELFPSLYCSSLSSGINSQGAYWESQKDVWGHRLNLHQAAALPLFRTCPERAAKSLSKAEHTGLWLHPPAQAALVSVAAKYQLSLKVTPHYAIGTQTPGQLQYRLRSCKHGLLFLPLQVLCCFLNMHITWTESRNEQTDFQPYPGKTCFTSIQNT